MPPYFADLRHPHSYHTDPHLGPAPERRQHQAGRHLCTLLLHPAVAGHQDGGVSGAVCTSALSSSQEASGQDALEFPLQAVLLNIFTLFHVLIVRTS